MYLADAEDSLRLARRLEQVHASWRGLSCMRVPAMKEGLRFSAAGRVLLDRVGPEPAV